MPNEHTIAENLQRLIDAKDDIADAIVAKSVTVPQGSGLEDFASLIGAIPESFEMCQLTASEKLGMFDGYMMNTENYTYIFGSFETSSYSNTFSFTYPSDFVVRHTRFEVLSSYGKYAVSAYSSIQERLKCTLDTSVHKFTITRENNNMNSNVFIIKLT